MLRVCQRQFFIWLHSPRVYILLFVGLAPFLLDSTALVNLSIYLNQPLGIWDSFIYSSSNQFTIALSALGCLFLFADAPFISKDEVYILLRVSRKNWLLSKIICVVIGSGAYYILILIATTAFTLGNASFGEYWSVPLTVLANNGADLGYQTELYFAFPYIIKSFSPLISCVISLMLNVLYSVVLGILMLYINLLTSKGLGFAVSTLVHAVGYLFLVYFNGIYAKYSLLGNSLLGNLNPTSLIGTGTVFTSSLVLCTLLFALLLLLFIQSKKFNIFLKEIVAS